jgi:glutamyl-tRNA reductase
MTRDGMELSGPHISVVGVNYSNTPLSIRGKLSVPKVRKAEALNALRDYVPHGVVLATCNRTEVYVLDEDGYPAAEAVRRFLRMWSGVPGEEMEPYLYCSHDYTAARHLARAAAGLYSMIVGEYEVLGQVREALQDAEGADMVNYELRNLFQHAIRTGRRVREETEISKNALSVSSVAVDLAARVTGDISRCRVLLMGAGEAGWLVARALTGRGVSQMTVTSRSLDRAHDLASTLGGTVASMDELLDEMKAADIVITCTGAPHYVIHRDAIQEVIASRGDRPLVMVDIAVPRDVEPEIREIEGVFLYDIDDLDHVSEANRLARQKEVERAMHIVDDEMESFVSRWQELEARPVIASLTEMAERIRQRQLEMSLKKLPSLSAEEQDVLDVMTKSIVSRLLHNPIQCLKENGHRNEDFIRMVSDLFALDERGSA